MSSHEAPRVELLHPQRLDCVLAIEVEDHVTVTIEERDALSGRELRHLVVDLRRPEEAGILGVLVALGYLDLDSLERILGVLGHGHRLRDLDDHERAVAEVIMATKVGLDEMLARDDGDA